MARHTRLLRLSPGSVTSPTVNGARRRRSDPASSAALLSVHTRRIAVEAAVVLLVTTAFVCGLFWRMVTALGSTLLEPASDAPGAIGWLYALPHEGGYHLFGTMHHTFTGAPFGWDESNALNIQWLIPYYPAYVLTKLFGALAAFNLVLLSGYILSGAAMYLLVRYVGCRPLVAGWAGLVYIVFPWHLMRVPHASLVHLEFLPLLLVFLVAAARRPTWFRFGSVAAATAACWLTSGYYGAMAVIMTLAFALGILLTRAFRHGRMRFFVLATASTLAGTLTVGAFARAADVGRTTGLNRRLQDVHSWGLHLDELVVPAARNFVFGRWTEPFLHTHQHGSYPVETTNYLGILTILLAGTWVVLAWRRRASVAARALVVTPTFAVVAVVALLFALPGPVSIAGHSVWTPSWILWQVVPAFRVPSRWSVVMMTALVPLAALALQDAAAVASRYGRRWKAPALGSALVVTAAAVSFAELALDPTTSRLSTKPEPTEYAALARTPPGIVAEYPLVPQFGYFFWQSVHHRRLLNTSAFGSPADDAQHALVNPSTPGTAAQLALLGVTAIVTHGDALRWSAAEYPRNPKDWGPGYRFVAGSPAGDSTWQVVARPAPAFVAAVSGFAPPAALGDGTPAFALVSPSGVGYHTIRARSESILRLTFDAAPPEDKQRVLRLADDSTERHFALNHLQRVSVVVRAPRGVSLVLVKTDPAPTSLEDAIVLSHLQVGRVRQSPELRAVPENADPGF
jgi:hypothetical protein